jgi:hypothetical protein
LFAELVDEALLFAADLVEVEPGEAEFGVSREHGGAPVQISEDDHTGFKGLGRDVGASGVELFEKRELLVQFRRQGDETPLPERLGSSATLFRIQERWT